MKIFLILISLFHFCITLTIPFVDIGNMIPFDSTNNEIRIPYDGPEKNIFLYLISHEKYNLGYELKCDGSYMNKDNIMKKDFGIIFHIYGGDCYLKLLVDEGDKGNLTVYDFKATFEIKLKNKYGNNNMDLYSYISIDNNHYDESVSKLKFFVTKFRTNLTITFEYTKKVESISEFENPFEVCHENICKNNITSYYFEEGKNYQIYVKMQKVTQDNYHFEPETTYAIPPFTFYAQDYNENYSNDDIDYIYKSNSYYQKIFMGNIFIFILLFSFLF